MCASPCNTSKPCIYGLDFQLLTQIKAREDVLHICWKNYQLRASFKAARLCNDYNGAVKTKFNSDRACYSVCRLENETNTLVLIYHNFPLLVNVQSLKFYECYIGYYIVIRDLSQII